MAIRTKEGKLGEEETFRALFFFLEVQADETFCPGP